MKGSPHFVESKPAAACTLWYSVTHVEVIMIGRGGGISDKKVVGQPSMSYSAYVGNIIKTHEIIAD